MSLLIQWRTLASDRPDLHVQLLAVRDNPWQREGEGESSALGAWQAVIEVRNAGKRGCKLIKAGLDAASGALDVEDTMGSTPLPTWVQPDEELAVYLMYRLRGLAQLTVGASGPVRRVWVEDADGKRWTASIDQSKLARWADPSYDGGFVLPFDQALPDPRIILGSSARATPRRWLLR